MLRYEHRNEKLLPRRQFIGRLAAHALLAGGIAAVSLAVGMLGYHALEGLSWVDSFLNASMILGGMGPVAELHTSASKVFAGLYALYSGMILLIIVGLLLAPVLHRMLHKFHLSTPEEDSDDGAAPQKAPRARHR
jgi:hypothetical protein